METIAFARCLVQLQHGTDESYQLHVPAEGSPLYAHIEVSAMKILTWNKITQIFYTEVKCPFIQ